MIKHINYQNVSTTPFRATKARELYNVQNSDVVILEQYSSSVIISDTPVALDYVDYITGTPLLNRDCNIALEQQDQDMAIYEEGISGSAYKFNSQSAEINLNTGTYKGLLYNQIYRAFYNEFHNPTEIFGMENIDLPLSKTNRYLADKFRMFTVPKFIMGDKIAPGSVTFQDTLLDDNVNVQDDSNGNLIAGNNLFSKVQEVRGIGNYISQGSASYTCPIFNDNIPLGPYNLVVVSGSSILTWQSGSSDQDYFAIQKSLTGINYVDLATSLVTTYTDVNVTASESGTSYWYQVAAVNMSGTSSFSNTASITFFYNPPTGSIIANVTSGSANVSWTSSITNANHWDVYKSLNADPFSYLASTTASVMSYYDTDVEASISGNLYSYKVAAINSYGTSSFSNTASISFAFPAPCNTSPFPSQYFTSSLNVSKSYFVGF